MKSVEQEVWMQLHLQRLKLCLRELRLQPRSAHFAFTETTLIIERVGEQEDQPIDHRPVVGYKVDVHQQPGERELAARISQYVEEHQIVERAGHDANQKRRPGMNGKTAQPLQPLYRKTRSKPQN